MRLMIVDDEDLEHKGLSQMVSGLGLDLEICCDAWNGQEALAMAEVFRPDIVVTDVRMPVMGGIAFASKLRAIQPSCFILFISGFEDFQAARDALLLGASAWLVKPVNREELLHVLSGICDQAQIRICRRQQEEQREKRLEELLPLERQEFLRSLLKGRELCDYAMVAEHASALGMQLYPGWYVVMAVETQEAQQRHDGHLEERLAVVGRAGIFPDVLEPVPMPGSRLALVLNFPGIAGEAMILSRLESIAEQMRLQFTAGCGVCTGIGVSLIGDSPETLAELYGQACNALDQKVRYGRGRVIFYSDRPQERITEGELISSTQILKAVEDGNSVGLDQLSKAFIQWIDICPNKQTALSACMDLVSQLPLAAQSQSVIKEWLTAEQPIYDKLIAAETIPDLVDYMKRLMESLTTALEKRNAGRNEQIIRHVRKIIQQGIGGDLSAETIAARVYLTASHLRRVFKNRMGVTLQDYVLHIRMERARELLGEPDSRVHMVASTIGYESTSYFCMVFKRFYGVSPGEFRAGLNYSD